MQSENFKEIGYKSGTRVKYVYYPRITVELVQEADFTSSSTFKGQMEFL